MEIYIKIEPLEYAAYGNGWYVDETESGCGSYIADGDSLYSERTGENRGSAASSWRQARSWAKVARAICAWDYGKCRITFWSFRRDKLVRVSAPRKSRKSCR